MIKILQKLKQNKIYFFKNYADYMVGSQEVELGTGWDYAKVLEPFLNSSLDIPTFAKHIVAMFEKAYAPITNDFTQAALDLEYIQELENNVHMVAETLYLCLSKQKNNTVRNAIKASRNKLLCTHFDEPSYIDLHHFYSNLQSNVRHFAFLNEEEEHELDEESLEEMGIENFEYEEEWEEFEENPAYYLAQLT